MRCLALAQAWQSQGGSVTFLSCCEESALQERVSASGFGFIPLKQAHPAPDDLKTTLSQLGRTGSAWLAADGYHFDLYYQQAVRAAGYHLLVIDDTACWPEYAADVLLNQNVNADALPYKTNADAKLLLGPTHALLRREFLDWSEWRRTGPAVARKVLVTMGGSDPDNVTLSVLEALTQVDMPGLEVKLVAGPANPHHDLLRRAVDSSTVNVELLKNVADMPLLMSWADVAVSAAGSTSWELAFMGLPSILMVLADNQKGVARGLDQTGAAISLDEHNRVSQRDLQETLSGLLQDVGLRQQISQQARALVDGKGAARVVEALMTGRRNLKVTA